MNESKNRRYVLTVSCPEANGIVRAVSDFLFARGATIVDSAEHRDPVIDYFFMRVEFEGATKALPDKSELQQQFSAIGHQFNMDWGLFDSDVKARVLLAVSRHSHCLNDILHRWGSGVLPAEIVGVLSNHQDLEKMTRWYGLPFHYLPVGADNRQQQEQDILRIIRQESVDLFALARYMQILSNDMCEKMSGRIINIHHSFLPGFKGADPYRQAYMRGVKVIGATAHYVTADLDEGPIIEQAVEKIDHNFTIEGLVQVGRDAECVAFSRAVKWHCEHRIIINGNKTVVFR